jgi:hypothetical protein
VEVEGCVGRAVVQCGVGAAEAEAAGRARTGRVGKGLVGVEDEAEPQLPCLETAERELCAVELLRRRTREEDDAEGTEEEGPAPGNEG